MTLKLDRPKLALAACFVLIYAIWIVTLLA